MAEKRLSATYDVVVREAEQRLLAVRKALEGTDGRPFSRLARRWNHLVHLLPATSPATAAFLLDDFLRRLSSIQKSLAEYFHKCDYRYSHEPKGAEQTAYLRAVEIFSGPPEKVLLSEPW
ncbi:MAG TPA: hypothetical protein GX513_06440 [Firmicutes bacterium]|nr:hypothetical protein [Bacillota bacterium]